MPDSKTTAPAVVEISPADLPAFCPNRKMTIWSQHPRVYLDVQTEGRARCPYCGTEYRLRGGAAAAGNH